MPRSYPPEFRRKVLDLLKAGRTVTQLANDLQISGQTIYVWRRQEAIDNGELPGVTSTELAELNKARLRIAELDLLRAHLDSHHHDHVFTGRDGGLHRRSSFHRRHWHPAVEGDPDNGIPAIVRGLHIHDLRHSHKTWLIEDGVPEAAQAKRPGHRLPGVRGIYSHVSSTVEQRLAAGLHTRWEQNRSPFRRDNLGN